MTDRAVFTVDGTTIRIRVFVQPRASRPGIAGVHGDALKVRVAAPPEDGRANEEVCRLLALALSVSRRAVTVSAGHTSRTKTVEIASDDTAAADAAISRLLLLPQP
ncbi:MAG: DUF167 domain-containing protein [Acidimicrobiia bacterium]|nr:DUF167 domain-containing protein [Acidimicrobiia bacterium]